MFNFESIHRQLNATGNGADDGLDSPDDSDVLRSTLRVYGSIFLFVFSLFCHLRRRFPRTYCVRGWASHVKIDLANDQHGIINWVWRVWRVSNDDIRDECGLDALCYLRALKFGFRLACVGMFNSIWLLPVYSTADQSSDTMHITDRIAKISVGNIPSGSTRFLGTVVAAYIFFGFTMYFIILEFRWFTKHRHHFLKTFSPRNYSIYVQNIPIEYRSSGDLLHFFRRIFATDSVLQAHVALDIPALDKKVARRMELILNLEHDIAVRNKIGTNPAHRKTWWLAGDDQLDSIETYEKELGPLTTDISNAVQNFARSRRPALARKKTSQESSRHLMRHDEEFGKGVRRSLGNLRNLSSTSITGEDEVQPLTSSVYKTFLESSSNMGGSLSGTESLPTLDETDPLSMPPTNEVASELDDSERTKLSKRTNRPIVALKEVSAALSSALSSKLKEAAKKSTSVASHATHTALNIISSHTEDGSNRSAGFVTFTSLRCVQTAIQNIQHSEPFVMDIEPAPEPSEIFWHNVGRPLHEVQAGKLISIVLTAGLCVFWTIPVSLIASLTAVESLKGTFDFLFDLVEKWPWIDDLLALIAPLVLLLLNSAILPLLLRSICKLEHPVAASILEASSFTKMTSFVIIQTFFVSTISGTITSELTNILRNPESVVTFLANSLPGQSTYFIQLLIVSTSMGLSLELIRVVPIIQATVRSNIGYSLTEKERNQTVFGMRPLSNPDHFHFARIFSSDILYFMVLFVYSTLAPIVSWFVGFFFLLMGSGYRHNFIYIYPKTPDSGGKLWIGFIKILMSCMLIAQLTIVGFLALKKSTIAVPLMLPLIGMTVIFNFFVRQRHFRISENLPACECLSKDSENIENNVSFDEFKDQYLQPSLTVSLIEPE